MKNYKKLVLAVAFAAFVTLLSACETMDTAMSDVKQKMSDMDITMPEITPREDASSYVDDERMASMHTVRPARQSSSPAQDETMAGVARKDIIAVGGDENCPPVSIIDELNEMHQFPDPEHPAPQSKISDIELTGIKSSCTFNGQNVAVNIDLNFEGHLGPGARQWNTEKPSFAYPYFVAITAPDGNIIAKEVFAATVAYEKGQENITHTENLRQVIPLNGTYSTDHTIMIGFQLTESELAYNRSLSGTAPHVVPAREAAVTEPPPATDPMATKIIRPEIRTVTYNALRKPEKPAPKTAAAPAPKEKPKVAAKTAPEKKETKQVTQKEESDAAAVTPSAGSETAREPITEFDDFNPLEDEEDAVDALSAMPEETPAPEPEAQPAPAPAKAETATKPATVARQPEKKKILPVPKTAKDDTANEIAPDAVYIPKDPDPKTVIDITAD